MYVLSMNGKDCRGGYCQLISLFQSLVGKVETEVNIYLTKHGEAEQKCLRWMTFMLDFNACEKYCLMIAKSNGGNLPMGRRCRVHVGYFDILASCSISLAPILL